MEDFEILGFVGEGSFASVLKAKRKSDQKIYALKRVNIQKMSHKDVQQAFNEIRFLASLRHPHIVRYYESFQVGEAEICIVLEFCSNGDLAQDIETQKKKKAYYEEQIIWNYLVQLLEALKVLHKHNIVHRDVKTANCFLGDSKSIKLGDMNISKRIKNGVLLQTQTGTPYYMSPEIWENKPYGYASDIWALGVLAYELCTFRKPFTATSFPELQRKVLSGTYAPIKPRYSRDMISFISVLLQVDPLNRPTAKELLDSQIIQRYRTDKTAPLQSEGEYMEILDTIIIPENFGAMRLDDQFPAPCYDYSSKKSLHHKSPSPNSSRKAKKENQRASMFSESSRSRESSKEELAPIRTARAHKDSPSQPQKQPDVKKELVFSSPRKLKHHKRGGSEGQKSEASGATKSSPNIELPGRRYRIHSENDLFPSPQRLEVELKHPEREPDPWKNNPVVAFPSAPQSRDNQYHEMKSPIAPNTKHRLRDDPNFRHRVRSGNDALTNSPKNDYQSPPVVAKRMPVVIDVLEIPNESTLVWLDYNSINVKRNLRESFEAQPMPILPKGSVADSVLSAKQSVEDRRDFKSCYRQDHEPFRRLSSLNDIYPEPPVNVFPEIRRIHSQREPRQDGLQPEPRMSAKVKHTRKAIVHPVFCESVGSQIDWSHKSSHQIDSSRRSRRQIDDSHRSMRSTSSHKAEQIYPLEQRSSNSSQDESTPSDDYDA